MSEEKRKHGLLLDMTVEALGSPGLMVNPDIAARTPCRCYTYKGEPKICYSKGIIGSMSKGQIEAYCKPLIKVGESKRVKEFIEAKEEALKEIEKIPPRTPGRLEKWLSAMGKALRKRGIEV